MIMIISNYGIFAYVSCIQLYIYVFTDLYPDTVPVYRNTVRACETCLAIARILIKYICLCLSSLTTCLKVVLCRARRLEQEVS